ncbi:Exostosin domain-containing protein [Cephalotus follicularis]|uniref:Exostosin domain-containing protein n=1 Tax=Cephalotus follicularis TaxID=3775 RepID=A0A1Q3D1P0_CEPFO|nr:Exostosin domain-containing protein [Cephalotus follicularis]
MNITVLFRRLRFVELRRLLVIISLVIAAEVVFQCFTLPNRRASSLSPTDMGSKLVMVGNATVSNHLKTTKIAAVNVVANDTDASNLGGKDGYQKETEETIIGYVIRTNKSITLVKAMENGHGDLERELADEVETRYNLKYESKSLGGVGNNAGIVPVISDSFSTAHIFSGGNVKQTEETQPKNTALLQTVSVILNNNSTISSMPMLKRSKQQPILLSQMNSILLQNHLSSLGMRPRWSSKRDRELLLARQKIENAPSVRNRPGLYASVFRNVSMFIRSYELMGRMLKVYIYREGEKPIFHQQKMRGIYASEGWFMKLMEGNRKFVVRDPKKAHLFYLPFSTTMLRTALFQPKFHSHKNLEKFLRNYVELIAGKYRFWNRTGGADHFLVACHDWASQLTRNHMRNCIRVLCNANVARGFTIGKDTTLPVTYVRSVQDPSSDLGGKPPTERPILAFFAGGMHGYLRPILLHYWGDKEPDMKIFGPMPRDIEGKKIYRDYMKSSKYCICARGYEVHTPRVVEAIFYECVPVIISDNYVPPFFELLNWESFSVFVQEKDVPNLRNILLSITEEKYLALQSRVKMVQQHFLWHKQPVKYDLFHMILHSVWYNRVFHIKPR